MPEQIANEGFSALNLISLLGLVTMIGLAWLMSSYRTQVNWRLVVLGVGLQLALGALFFNSQTWTFDRDFNSFEELFDAVNQESVKPEQVDAALAREDSKLVANGKMFASFTEVQAAIELQETTVASVAAAYPKGGLSVPRFRGGVVFYAFDELFVYILKWTEAGSSFVFRANGLAANDVTNPLYLLKTFTFGVLPTVIFFAALMSVLYHIGVMMPVVRAMAWVMQKTLGTSGSESLAAAANVFVGHTEAPLVVRPFIATMTRSELNAMMVGGFATITGGLMAVFVAEGISAGHLVTASIISAPAALVIAKILQPETQTSETLGVVSTKIDRRASNVIEAAARGASDGMKLAINIAAMLIAFLALIAMVDTLLFGLGELIEYLFFGGQVDPNQQTDLNWSLNGVFGILFWPLAWIMGIEARDCGASGQMLGTKMVVNEFVAYLDLGKYLTGNVTTIVDGKTVPVSISERTEVILTYALCGFSNFGAIGIQLGGIGPLAPNRTSDLAQLGLRAMLGGMITCCMTACVAGLMYGILN